MNEKEKRLVKIRTEKGRTDSQCFQLLSMVLNYQNKSSGIQLGYAVAEKLQIFQHFVHMEVNSTFSTA